MSARTRKHTLHLIRKDLTHTPFTRRTSLLLTPSTIVTSSAHTRHNICTAAGGNLMSARSLLQQGPGRRAQWEEEAGEEGGCQWATVSVFPNTSSGCSIRDFMNHMLQAIVKHHIWGLFCSNKCPLSFLLLAYGGLLVSRLVFLI